MFPFTFHEVGQLSNMIVFETCSVKAGFNLQVDDRFFSQHFRRFDGFFETAHVKHKEFDVVGDGPLNLCIVQEPHDHDLVARRHHLKHIVGLLGRKNGKMLYAGLLSQRNHVLHTMAIRIALDHRRKDHLLANDLLQVFDVVDVSLPADFNIRGIEHAIRGLQFDLQYDKTS